MQKLPECYPFIGEVRGRGLVIGIDLLANRQTRERLDRKFSRMIFDECLKCGLLVMAYQPNIRIQPPLVLTGEMAEGGIQVLTEVFDAIGDQIVAEVSGG